MKKRALSFLLVLLLAVSLLPAPALAGGEDELDPDVIGVIVEGIENWETEIDISEYGILQTEINNYIRSVTYGHPELFYIKNQMGYSVSDGYVTMIIPQYDNRFTEDSVETFESVCGTIVAGIPDGSTTEEKLLYIHDYIVTHCEYDTTYTKRSAYDCLVLGSAVCDGYSRAFLYLCSLARLNVHVILSEKLNHSWNIARVKNSGTISSSPGAYYYIDCTWDDPSNFKNLSHCVHDEFLIQKSLCYSGHENAPRYGTDAHNTSDWVDESGVNAFAFYDTDNFYETGNYGWWAKLNRPVQWIGSLMCYAKMNDRSHVFFRNSGSATETSIALPAAAGESGTVKWYYWEDEPYYYGDSYITVAAFNGSFYFTTPTQVWKLTTDKQTSLIYTLTSAEQAKGYIYALRIQNGKLVYDVATSPDEGPVYTGTLNVGASVTITTQPKSVTAAPDTTAKFTVVASGSSLTYQWQVSTNGGSTWSDSPATGNKTATLSIPVTTSRNGYKYRCVVKSGSSSVTSAAATLTVSASGKPVITTQPTNVTAAEGGNATFKVVASGSGLSYQWQYLAPGGSTWSNSPATGNKTATLTVPVTSGRNGYKYRCVVKNSSGTVTSSAATLTVSGGKPVITTQPKNVTAAEGGNATFKVVASGSGLSYQWQVSTNGGSAWSNSPATGNKTATLTVPVTAARNGYKYRCVVKNSSGTVTSSAATLTVSGGKPVITTQPQNVTAASGNVTFKVVASGSGLSYQWQVCEAGKTTWKDSPATGNKTATLTVPVTAARNGYKYRCVVKNSSGTVTSSAATLTVTGAQPVIASQPANVTMKASGNATFKVTVTGTGLSYQWQYCEPNSSVWKNSPATGNKTATLTIPATAERSGNKYRCIITNSGGSVTSSAATLTVLAITTQPKSVTKENGTTATFKVTATGTGLTYQWQVSTNGGSTWSDSPATGNKTATLTVPVTPERDGYKYRCIVKLGSLSVTSSAATLSVTGY